MTVKHKENTQEMVSSTGFGSQTIRALILTLLFFVSIIIYHGIGQ